MKKYTIWKCLSIVTVLCLSIPLVLQSSQQKLNILVYPLHYQGPPQLAWMSSGFTDSVITDLMKIRSLNVFSENDRLQAIREIEKSMAGLSTDEKAKKLGSLVGANLILTGSIQVADGNLRIVTRLMDVQTAQVYRSKKLDGSPGEMTDLLHKIVVDLMDEKAGVDGAVLPLPLVVTGDEKRKIMNVPRRKYTAYRWYAMGLENSITDPEKALEYFQNAIKIESAYFEAFLEAALVAGRLAERETIDRMSSLEDSYLRRAGEIVRKEKRCEYKYAYVLMITGMSLGQQHRLERARKYLLEAMPVLKCLGQERSSNYASLVISLGNISFMEKKYDKSLAFYHDAQSIYSSLGLKTSIGYANVQNNIANVYSDNEQYQKAIQIYRETHFIVKKLRENNPGLYDSTLVNAGTVYRLNGDYNRAKKFYTTAMDMIIALDMEYTYKHATLLINYAAWHEEQKNYAEAARMYRQAYSIYTELGYEGPLKKLAGEHARKNMRRQ